MKIFGIIPARLNSTRLPRKALIQINEKTLIQRVYENIKKITRLEAVFVATNDTEIKNEVHKFSGNVITTKKNHSNGTARCYEAVKKLKIQDPKKSKLDTSMGMMDAASDPYAIMMYDLIKLQNSQMDTKKIKNYVGYFYY